MEIKYQFWSLFELMIERYWWHFVAFHFVINMGQSNPSFLSGSKALKNLFTCPTQEVDAKHEICGIKLKDLSKFSGKKITRPRLKTAWLLFRVKGL